jgi:hypothetical protein
MMSNQQRWNHIDILVTKKVGMKDLKVHINSTKGVDCKINDIHGIKVKI